MRRSPTAASVLTLFLALASSVAGAQVNAADSATSVLALASTAQAQAALNTVTIADVPADHWAREAVTLMVKRGLISGFPDSTFRGNQPLTRYQAALILARALPQLNTSTLPAEEQAVIARALTGLKGELQIISGQVQLLSDMLGTQQGQITALQTGQQADQGRTAALERDVAALRGQVAALSGNYTALGTQIDALKVQQTTDALGTAPVTGAPAPAPSPADVAAQPDAPFAAKAEVPTNLKSAQFAIGAFGALGVATQAGVVLDYRLSPNGPLALQLYGSTSLGGVQASGLGLNASYDFGKSGQDLRPYVYAGVGASLSESWTTTGSALDLYGRVGGGSEYRMADTVSLFADAYLNYHASNNGLGTGLPQSSGGGPGFGARAGVKLRF